MVDSFSAQLGENHSSSCQLSVLVIGLLDILGWGSLVLSTETLPPILIIKQTLEQGFGPACASCQSNVLNTALQDKILLICDPINI